MGQFFRWCIRRGYCDGDPTDAWERKPEVVRKKYVFLSQSEIRRLFEAADTLWLRRFIVLATSTGAREGTLRLADWSWVDSSNRLHLPAWALKTKEAKCLPLSDWALEMIGPRAAPATPAPEGEGPASAAPATAAPRPATLAGPEGQGMRGAPLLIPGMPGTVQVWRAVKRAGRRAGLDPALGPHDLRRTFSGRLLELGVSPERVQQLGGWRSRGVFLGHYFPPVGPEEAQRWVNGI